MEFDAACRGCGIGALSSKVVGQCVAFTWEVSKGVVGELEQCSVLDINKVLLNTCIAQACIVVEVLYEG